MSDDIHWLRYGIDRPSPPSGSHPLGKLWQVYDSAGLVEHTAYDVDGNLIASSRTFLDANHTDATWRAADDALPDWAYEADATGSTSLAPLEATAHTQSWTYDAQGRLLTHTLADGRDADPTVLTRTYDEGGRLLSLSRNHRGDSTPTDDLTSVTYNARGQRETIGYGNGVTTSFTYDPLTFRLTGLLSVRPNASPSWPTTLQDLRYVYDPNGNPAWTDDRAIDDQTYGGVLITAQRTYTYDGLDRLTEATGRGHNSDLPSAADPAVYTAVAHPNDAPAQHNYTRTYTYDLFGNRTELVHTAHVSGPPIVTTQETLTATGHNRLASYTVGTGTFSPTYDNHGNMVVMSHLPLMAYNALDRLAVVSGIAGSTPDRWRYFYDTAGERVRKLLIAGSATVLKERRYLGASEVYIEWSGSTETELRETVHVHDEAGRVLLVDTDVIGGGAGTADEVKTRFQLADHLGSVSIELDEDAAVVTYEEYFPYGCAAFRGGRSESEVNNKRYRYTGMERDDESGLRYHSQRYYASWLGRWVRPDPIGLKGGTNLATYVHNSPVALSDPDGLLPPDDPTLFSETREQAPPTYVYDRTDPVHVSGGLSREEMSAVQRELEQEGPIYPDVVVVAFSGDARGGSYSTSDGRGGGSRFLLEAVAPTLRDNNLSFEGQELLPGVSDTVAVWRAISWLEGKVGPDTRVVLFGFSRGGDLAMRTADALNEVGTDVDLLFLADPTEGPLSVLPRSLGSSVTVAPNVKQVVATYQDQDNWLSGEAIVTSLELASPNDTTLERKKFEYTASPNDADGRRIDPIASSFSGHHQTSLRSSLRYFTPVLARAAAQWSAQRSSSP